MLLLTAPESSGRPPDAGFLAGFDEGEEDDDEDDEEGCAVACARSDDGASKVATQQQT